jgi:hypothetical protein
VPSLAFDILSIVPFSLMKVLLIILGVLLDLLGIAWILQGANVLTGSAVMSGKTEWLVIGIIVDAVGTILLVTGILRKPRA